MISDEASKMKIGFMSFRLMLSCGPSTKGNVNGTAITYKIIIEVEGGTVNIVPVILDIKK